MQQDDLLLDDSNINKVATVYVSGIPAAFSPSAATAGRRGTDEAPSAEQPR